MRFNVLLAALVVAPSLGFTPPSLNHLLNFFERDSKGGHDAPILNVRKPFFRRRDNVTIALDLGNVTQPQYLAARAMVDEALEEVEDINKARLANPSRNHYSPRQRGQSAFGKTAFTAQGQSRARHFKMTKELKCAADIIAQIDALNDPERHGNKTFGPAEKRAEAAGNFWMQNIKRQGSWPWGKNPNHKVFRNVKDYGAKGDGKTDDTDAINKAIAEKDDCSGACYGSTTMGAILYFPPGTYLIKSTIELSYGMQVIGDAINPPTLKSDKNFFGLGVLSTDKYWGDGQKGEDSRDHQYYINTANFHRQIRNFVIDTTGTSRPKAMAALHYQVAQATSLQNIVFKLSPDANTEQVAIYAENGSGGFMSDLSFIAGKTGIYGGNQQFTAQRLSFLNVRTAVEMIWDWGWMWKSIKIENSHIGFNLTNGFGDGHVGSITVVDSVFKNCDIALLMANTNSSNTGRTSVSLDNVLLDGVTTWLREQSGKDAPKDNKVPGNHRSIDMLTVGRAYSDTKLDNEQGVREFSHLRVDGLVGWQNPWGLPKKPYAERSKPQYEARSADSFIHLKDFCKGDGVTDDTACFQKVLNDNQGGKIIFVDAGTYILTDTVVIPKGSHIVGENWAQLAAYGAKFQDIKKPRVVLRMGQPGDVGQLEIQDLVFTSKGPTPGAVFVEWNIQGYKGEPGSAGMWDCHVRVGGAMGTGLTSKECPPSRSGINPNCQGGSMMMHLTKQGGAYLENVWLWTADHDLDDPSMDGNANLMVQTSVYNARGFLIESKNPTWLYGTASEHSVFYQYQFFQASNLVAGIIQTEQPYYQPTPNPPEPFKDAVGTFNSDPTFPCNDTEPCDEGWGLRMVESQDVHIIGAGLYSWFDTYTQDCVPKYTCQKVMTQFKNNHGGIMINNLITIGATNMINADGKLIGAKDNLAVNSHPFWSNIVAYSPGGSPRLTPPQPIQQKDEELQDTVDRMNAHLNEDCFRFNDCVDMGNLQVSSCGTGYTSVGYDRGGCGKNHGKPICCKTKTRPSSCTWRGGGLHCNGQCHEGEVHLFWSSWGGSPTEGNEKQCTRGGKVFCCKNDEFPNLTHDCRWTGCAETCDVTEADVAFALSLDDKCRRWKHDMHYCCKHNRAPLQNCHWVGQGDCADNTCNDKEVVLARDQNGDSSIGCFWGRKRVLCCTPSPDLSEFYCDASVCSKFDVCQKDEYEWDEDDDPDDAGDVWDPAPPWVPPPGDHEHDELRRRASGLMGEADELSVRQLFQALSELSISEAEVPEVEDLELVIPRQGAGKKPPKGASGRRSYRVRHAINSALELYLYARRYHGPSRVFNGRLGKTVSRKAYRQGYGTCSTTNIESVNVDSLTNFDDYDNDHSVENQYIQDFVRAIVNSRLPSGAPLQTPGIPFNQFEAYWNYDSQNLPKGGPRPAPNTRSDFLNLNDKFFECIGSTTNRKGFRLLEKGLNGAKGRLMNIDEDGKRVNPVSPDRMRLYIQGSIALGSDEEDFLSPMRAVIAIWRYMREPEVLDDMQNVRRRVAEQSRWASQTVNDLRNLRSIFDEFDADYWQTAANWASSWIRDNIALVRRMYQAASATGQTPVNAQRVYNELRLIEQDLQYILALPPY